MRNFIVAACGSAALAVAAQGTAQTGSSSPSAQLSNPDEKIVVQGKRMPTAEAPRAATCEALVKTDPQLKAQIEAANATGTLGPFIYLPTRMPRNPDYNATPLSPVGSPIPDLGRSRFGVGGRDSANQGNAAGQTNASDSIPEASDQTAMGGTAQEDLGNEFSDREVIAACRGLYSSGGANSLPGDPSGPEARGNPGHAMTAGGIAKFERGRAEIARHDKTLPTAFYLFDQRRFAESLEWFKRAERKLGEGDGGDEATLFIGKLYLHGLGDKSDPAEGVKWLKRAASMRFNPIRQTPVFDPKQPEMNTAIGEAAVILGNVYRTGFRGIQKDLAESRKWYERALAVGHLAAAKTLGDMHYEGVGAPRNLQKAANYYLKAARFGLPTAQYALAEIYYAGKDAPEGAGQRSLKTALVWYQAAAKQEHPGALFVLARAYDLGEGLKADQTMAIGIYKSAALLGHSGAIAAMGTYFYEGRTVPKDAVLARKWFEQAARSGDPDGAFNLAAMMVRGEGGPSDTVKAWALLKRASALGSERAPAALVALERKMTPDQRREAQLATLRE